MQRGANGLADGQLKKWKSPQQALFFFFGFGFVSTAMAGWRLVSSLGALQGRTLIVAGAAFLICITFLVLTVLTISSSTWPQKLWQGIFSSPRTSRLLLLTSGLFCLIFGMASLTPSIQFGQLAKYHAFSLPLLINGAVIGLAAFLISLVEVLGFQKEALSSHIRNQKPTLLVGVALFTLALIIWGILAWLDMGVQANEDLWYGAGTPLLSQQAWVSFLLAAILFLFEEPILAWLKKLTRDRIPADVLIFAGVWAVAAILWTSQPAPYGYVATRPQAPNYELYPFADAFRFDNGSQFALIGQGLNNGRFYYRVFYEGFLFLLHGVAGQNYELLMSIQAALLAVFPALIYLLGKAMKNRALGIFASIAVMFVGWNSIPASKLVDLANPKQMLTDFPTAIGMAGFTLLTVLWLKKPERVSMLFWAAGILGVTALVRTSALGLLPLLLVSMWVFLPHTWKEKSVLSIFVVIVFVASALPWSTWQGRLVTDMYSSKIKAVVGDRYNVPPVQGATDETTPKSRTSLVEAVADHFAHNLVTSTLILPASPVFHDLKAVVKDNFPYWDLQWDGSLDATSVFMIAINLAVLALGIGAAFQSASWTGLAPLVVYLGYIAINSLGRTSGGRYSVPMDWIFLFYYASGVIAILQWLSVAFLPGRAMQSETPVQNGIALSTSIKKILLQATPAFLILFGISAFMLILSAVVPKRYISQPTDQLALEFINKGYNEKVGIDAEALKTFLSNEQAGIWVGRALYPRYYLSNQGFNGPKNVPFWPKNYPRLVFSLIGPQDQAFVILPGPLPKHFPNAVDTIVLGCETDDGTIEAVAVVIQARKSFVYTIPSSVALRCPLELK